MFDSFFLILSIARNVTYDEIVSKETSSFNEFEVCHFQSTHECIAKY